jgi:hypothetical protein
MNKALAVAGAFFIGIATYAVITLVSAFMIQFFWNHSIPSIFHGPELTYWQAWFLNMLSIVLIKDTTSSFTNKK